MKKLILISFLFLKVCWIFAQQATMIDPNAITVPRFSTQAAMNAAIPLPTQGMFIYRNDTQSFWYYTSSGWKNMTAIISGNSWAQNGNDISNTNTANVGVGTATPTSKLDVNGQLTIDQKNFGGYGGLLIKGNKVGSNYPNIAFSTNNEFNQDLVTGMIGGEITNDNGGYEQMDLAFYTNDYIDGLTDRLRIKSDGSIGVGVNPGHKFQIGNNRFYGQAGLRVEGPLDPNFDDVASFGGYGNFRVDKPGIIGGRFMIKENGNIGIGTGNPNRLLSVSGNAGVQRLIGVDHVYQEFFPQGEAAGRKGWIGFESANSQDFAINQDKNASILFKTNNTTRMSINGDGAIGLSNGTGTSGQVLKSTGPNSPPRWGNIGKYSIVPRLTPVVLTGNTIIDVPGGGIPIIATDSARIIIYFRVGTWKGCLAGSCSTKWQLTAHLDGNPTPSGRYVIDAVSYSGLYESEAVYGPLVIDVEPGANRVLTLKGQNLFNEPTIQFIALSAHSTPK
jgi:hypothetical protein